MCFTCYWSHYCCFLCESDFFFSLKFPFISRCLESLRNRNPSITFLFLSVSTSIRPSLTLKKLHLSLLRPPSNSISTHFYLLSSPPSVVDLQTQEYKYETSVCVSVLNVWDSLWMQPSCLLWLLLPSSAFVSFLPSAALQKTIRKVRGVASHFSDLLPAVLHIPPHFLLLSPPPPAARLPVLFHLCGSASTMSFITFFSSFFSPQSSGWIFLIFFCLSVLFLV